MESDKDKMWYDAQKIVTKHVLDGNPDDDTLAEYLGKTVSRDYRVGSLKIFTSHAKILPTDIDLSLIGLHIVIQGDKQTKAFKGN